MNNAYCYKTPIGEIVIVDNGRSIVQVFFGDNIPKNVNVIETNLLKEANNQLKEYFIGKREKFDLYLEPQGTEFQKKVWKALQEIPYGETRSYKNIAINIGNEKACRAVGMANNKNPIPIFIPCHRVIGSNGNLIGYAGGLDIKETLLRIENKD
ncbi:methylated-DNA--[protein]-cysteine S-methyltransferase [Clostridium sp. LCP25S3_F10]|uniref:methylated-DNA--[protein]-cysteine S-methyltransferase n=1 Tax=Clostridium sp. LCP25S3_F10 TaxID=3438750 RepID=UPI003F8FAE56